MTQPVGLTQSLSYTPYDPHLELSQGAIGGSGGGESSGAEGAAGMSNAAPVLQEDPQCMGEMMKTVAACGAAYLASKVPSPLSLLPALNCAANVMDLVECLTEPDPKAQEP